MSLLSHGQHVRRLLLSAPLLASPCRVHAKAGSSPPACATFLQTYFVVKVSPRFRSAGLISACFSTTKSIIFLSWVGEFPSLLQ